MSRSVVRSSWDMHIVGREKSVYADEKAIVLDGQEREMTPPERNNRIAEIAQFASAVMEDREPEASGRNVRRTIAALEAGRISMQEGGTVQTTTKE